MLTSAGLCRMLAARELISPPSWCCTRLKTLAMSMVIALVFVIDGFAQERVRVSVALSPTGSYPILIAQEKGFFEKNGLKAEIIRINSDATNSQALISGDIDAARACPPAWCNSICRASA